MAVVGALEFFGLDVVLWSTGTGTAVASNTEVQQGMQLWRVWGGISGPDSPYWTNVNPETIANYSQAAQLPSGNTQQFLSTATLVDTSNVIIQQVPGGTVYEVIVPFEQVIVESVSGSTLP
jgi:hypothetical protein